MTAKLPVIKTAWVDPDDAPELTGDEMDRPDAVWSIAGRQVSPEEGKEAFRQIVNQDRLTNHDRRISGMPYSNADGIAASPM
ncbi:MAG: hypothetical protein H7834_15135 [Magnetococcus sp. YQC-9]